MKIIQRTALLLTITALASCQKEDTTITYATDPTAVKLTATVSSLFTRSNPIDDANNAFKTGDAVAVSAGSQHELNYTLNGTAWIPETDKYLRWDNDAMIFNAYYPARANNASMTNFDLPSDQSTLAKIEQTDYMTYTSPKPEEKASSVNLALTRKMARVVITPKFLDTYTGYTVDKIEVHSHTTGYTGGGVKSGKITITPLKHTDNKYYSLLSPTTLDAAANFFTLTVKKTDGGTPETLTVTGIPALEAGKSYAYDVEVGNNTMKITNITVTDWATGKAIPGGEAIDFVFDMTIWMNDSDNNQPTPKGLTNSNSVGMFLSLYGIDLGGLLPVAKGSDGSAEIRTFHTVSPSTANTMIPGITAGILFLGKFNMNAIDWHKSTYPGVPYTSEPAMFKASYRFEPGATFCKTVTKLNEKSESGLNSPYPDSEVGAPYHTTEVVAGEVDQCAITAYLYEVASYDEYLDGTNIDTSNKVILKARIVDGNKSTNYIDKEIPFQSTGNGTYDSAKRYKLAIVCSSSHRGNESMGAPDSKLCIKRLEVIAKPINP